MKIKTSKKLILIIAMGIVLISFSFQSKFFEVAKQLEIYTTLFKELNLYYVNEINPAALSTQAIKNTLKNLDPYTNFYNEQDVELARIKREGEYGGIGTSVSFTKNEITVVRVLKSYSADKAGVKPGDIITEINRQKLSDLNEDDISSLLLGVPGSSISLKVIRGSKTLNFDLKREKIEVNTVPFYQMIDKETGYIVLTEFNEKASELVKNAFDSLQKQGMKKLIFDLRGNPGGLLFEAIKISNFFLPKGKVIVSTVAKVKKWSNVYVSQENPLDLTLPIVVLINRNSASASEIVTGALQDYDRAVVMGNRSFGKGLVQRILPLAYGTQLKLTTSKYFTPSGRCIQELDYANRDADGRVPTFSERGRNTFKTQNGRTVYDGGGIIPDIKMDAKKLTPETEILLASKALFNYATEYYQQHKSLKSLNSFEISDTDFKKFTNYLETDTTFVDQQEKLFKTAYLAINTSAKQKIDTDYLKILKALKTEKIKSITADKEAIKVVLKELIIDRYNYQTGVYQNKIHTDKTILEALKLLKNQQEYQRILATKK